jgi:hypothetical protein
VEVTDPTWCDEIRRKNCREMRSVQPRAHGGDEADRELSTRTGLSAVTLEPLRPRTTHVVQLRSISGTCGWREKGGPL